KAGAAVLFRNQRREIAGVGQRLDEGFGIRARLVELAPIAVGERLAQLADRGAQIVLQLGAWHRDGNHIMRRMKRNAGLILAGLLAAVVCTSAQRGPRLLVLNKEDATFTVINPETAAVLATVPTGEGPHELVTSTDGKTAFASNYGTGPAPGHTISMIDIASGKELRRVDVAPLSRPHGLAFANGKLYFTAEADKKVARYDPAADKIDWQFETGQNATHMVLPTRDARTLFTSNISSDSISMIQESGGTWSQTVIPVGKGPEGLDLSP